MVSRQTMLINNQEVAIRSYEVSIWSLQDSFITVLKWANLDNRGQIQEPKMILDVDGTQNFTFSIPMYLHPEEENPIWYNTLNGNLMIGMRKIKVILNKKREEEAVFEFLITKVTERHEADTLFCDVECEGLAFHELGKIGYKVALSAELFQLKFEEWYKSDQSEEMPRQTIQFWNEQTNFLLPYPDDESKIVPNKWYYKIEMNWESYNSNLSRSPNKVYEDEYVSSWELVLNKLSPLSVEQVAEKERPVEISESNIYNITQKIAEAFGVFCKYEYGYDENYHIISRTVIYYNNFIEERNGHMDLTYPYHTSEITREMDSTELTTKLFVRPVDYEYSSTGQTSIMSVDANKSREDYILNFDYLHKFNIITDEQYNSIEEYETNMHNINLILESLEPQIQNLQNKIIEYKAKVTTAENGIEEADKQLNYARDQINALPNTPGGKVIIGQSAPKSLLVLTDETDNSLYVKMPVVGIAPETVRLYDGIIDYTKKENQLENDNTILITGGIFEFDEAAHDLIKITHLPKTVLKQIRVENNEEDNNEEDEGEENQNENIQTVSAPLSKSLWMTCEYIPQTYWQKIANYWEQRGIDIEQQKNNDAQELTNFEEALDNLQNEYKNKLDEKQILIKDFEEMMGPALREGYWQPEDYQDYGNKYFINSFSDELTQGKASYYPADIHWYSGNNKVTYYEGPEQKTYLVIDVNNTLSKNYILNNYENLCFVYYDVQGVEQTLTEGISEIQRATYRRNALRVIHIGGDCRFTFLKRSNPDAIILGLVIEASKYMTDEQIKFFKQIDSSMEENGHNYSDQKYSDFYSKIGTLAVDENTGEMSLNEGYVTINASQYLMDEIVQEVYPRIIIDSLSLKTGETQLQIKLHTNILKPYEDYQIHVETDLNDLLQQQHQKYMIDIKPMAFINTGVDNPNLALSYELSNADTLIYLDALEVAKENSQPKVSYEIKLSVYDPSIIHNIYQKLSKIVHINDNQLKFENVQGYIAKIEMLLDTPQEDEIEIKNYKTKFEDLFSNIVAQTDAMQKNSAGYDNAAAAFNNEGVLTSEAVEKMLESNITIFNTYIDTYLTDSPVIQSILTDVFNDVGDILSSAGNALFDMRNITSRNSSILAGFARDSAFGLSKIQVNDNGIFIGSDQRISLFSGDITTPDSGVSIDLNPQRLILGASSGSQGTAAKFTDKYLVLAAGDIIDDSEQLINTVIDDETVTVPKVNLEKQDVTGLTSGLVGAKFTKDSIGLATTGMRVLNAGTQQEQIQHIINAILMNKNGITLGSGVLNENGEGGVNITQDSLRNTELGGSYVRIAGTGIDIGSGADLYVMTNNLIINSEATEDNTIFALRKRINDLSEATAVYEDALTYSSQSGLTIKGNLQASSLVIEQGVPQAQSLSQWVNAKVTPERIWFGVKRATDPAQNNSDYQGTSLQLTDNMISIASTGTLNVNTANLIINSAATGTNSIFELKRLKPNSNNEYDTALKYSITDGLTITGNLSADTGTIGGWNIGNNSLYSGDDEIGTYVALDSGSTGQNYAIWAGDETSSLAPFRVRRDGKVYLHSLMVLDERVGTKWGLSGNHYDEYDETVVENDQSVTHHYGYAAIDFSKLNFKQAVSATGSWSGATFSTRVTLWGVLNKTINDSATISLTRTITIGSVGQGGGECQASVPITLTGGGSSSVTLQGYVDASAVYNEGWNACRAAVLNSASSHQYRTGGRYYAVLFLNPSENSSSVSNCYAGQNTVSVTTYSIPAAK